MLTESGTQTDAQGIGLSPEEEAMRIQQFHKEHDLLLEEHEDQYRILLEKVGFLESSLHTASRALTQLKLENGVLESEGASQASRILELEQAISQGLAKVSTLKSDAALRDTVIEQQEHLLVTIETQKRQIEEISRVNANTADSLSTEIDRLNTCLASSLVDGQQFTKLNRDLQQQIKDLKDQLARDSSVAPSPFTPRMGGPTLAADFWPSPKGQLFTSGLMSSNPLFPERSPPGASATLLEDQLGPFQEMGLEEQLMLTNALFIERQKNKLLADALQDRHRYETRSLNGSWINLANRNRILTLLDSLKGCKEDLHALPVASFMKVLHDVEATIQYGRSHQVAYATFASPCDKSFFFSHNKEGVKNSVNVTNAWERNVRNDLNQRVADCLINSSIAQGELAKITSGDIAQFRTECTRTVVQSIQNCIVNEGFSSYKAHSFRAYLHHLVGLDGLIDSGAGLIGAAAIHDKVTNNHFTKMAMEQTERGVRNRLSVSVVSFTHRVSYGTL